MRELVGRTAQGELGTVRLGVVGTALLSVMPALVQGVRGAHPDLTLELVEQTGADQAQELRSGRLDLGLIHAAAPATPAGLEMLAIRDEPLAVVLPEGHRLAHRSVLRLEELRDEPLVVPRREREADTHAIYLEACAAAGFLPISTREVTSLQALLGWVAAGLGWAFVAASMPQELRRAGVRACRLDGTKATLPTALAWSRDQLSASSALVREVATGLWDCGGVDAPSAVERPPLGGSSEAHLA